MHELSPDQYECVEPLVRSSGMRGHITFAYEVIDGQKKGKIYADDPTRPRAALVCNETGFFFAYGEPDEEALRPTLKNLCEHRRWPYSTVIFGSTPVWGEVLGRVLLPLGAKQTARLGFEPRNQPVVSLIPEGYTLQPITAELAQSILDGTGTGGYGIDPWFIRIQGGAEEYARHKLGFALVQDGQIASLCGFCAMARSEVELEVGTVPQQRGKGLAVIVSREFIKQCQHLGVEPVYTCTSNNLPSVAVAHKLGYAEVEEVLGYELPRDE